MRYLSAFYTDIGTQKKSNQDSLLIQEANTATGTTLRWRFYVTGLAVCKKERLPAQK